MFDFRYHALSLIAVLVALVLGLLLGVAIGDKGLVSSAENHIKDSLRADVRAEQKKSAALQTTIDQQDKFEQEVYPLLVAGQLSGKRIGVVFLGEAIDEINTEVEDALAAAGAHRVGAVAIREPLAASDLAARASGTRFATLDAAQELWKLFGARIGAQIVHGGKLLARVRRSLFESQAGSLGSYDGVVLVRNTPDGLTGDDLQRVTDFEQGLVKGLTATDTPVVGVERSDAQPSQVPWFRARGLSTVDDVDQTAGRAALVFVLTGTNDGAFGVHRPRLLPDIAGGGG